MLNLSDKELDRICREAANEHDPGIQIGPGAWDKVEWRLDTELGKTIPNPLRAVRRFPFYYAPAMLLLVGVSYFATRNNRHADRIASSGSPPQNTISLQQPPAAARQSTTETQNNADKANSTPLSNQQPTTASPAPSPAQAGTPLSETVPAAVTPLSGSAGASSKSTAAPSGGTAAAKSAISPGATTGSIPSGNPSGNPSNLPSGAPKTASGLTSAPASAAANAPTSSAGRASLAPVHHAASAESGAVHTGSGSSPNKKNTFRPDAGSLDQQHSNTAGYNSNKSKPKGRFNQGGLNQGGLHQGGLNQGKSNELAMTQQSTPPAPGGMQPANRDASNPTSSGQAGPGLAGIGPDKASQQPTAPREPNFAAIQQPLRLKTKPRIDDSALRNFSLAQEPIRPGQKTGNFSRTNRPLQFGLLVAPDFTSVNSLAGDKPGSTIGLTIDYEFINRLYISSGLLFSRKNYTAAPSDFHCPPNFFWSNNLHDVNLIKGSFHMIEVPINVRYDFSVVNNTIFFASAGFSSYFKTNEQCNYYFDFFGRPVYAPFKYANSKTYMFAAINLSLGLEAGISNSFSLLVAPYLKLPTGGGAMGFGQVKMSSMGLNLGVKYAPVLSRKRR